MKDNGKVKMENGTKGRRPEGLKSNLTYPLRSSAPRPPILEGQSVTTEYPKLSP